TYYSQRAMIKEVVRLYNSGKECAMGRRATRAWQKGQQLSPLVRRRNGVSLRLSNWVRRICALQRAYRAFQGILRILWLPHTYNLERILRGNQGPLTMSFHHQG